MTIPLLLALVIVHFALILPSAAFPDQIKDCEGQSVEDCLSDVTSAVDRSTSRVLPETSEGGGGIFSGITETAKIVASAVETVWSAMGIVGDVLTFNYKILNADSYVESDGVGTGIMGTLMLGLRTMLGLAQLVIGVRILLALRGSGGL